MSDQATAAGLNPDYIEPPFECETEREHQAYGKGRRAGYFEGRDDLLFALARHHEWALKVVEDAKARLTQGENE